MKAAITVFTLGPKTGEVFRFIDSPLYGGKKPAYDDVMGMPMTYNTRLIGDMGQKQRLLLARALYRQLRILLDVENEKRIDETLI